MSPVMFVIIGVVVFQVGIILISKSVMTVFARQEDMNYFIRVQFVML